MRPTRVIAYVRVSTDVQASEGVSLRAQQAKLRAFALALELQLVEVVVDEARSGRSLERPGLQRALALLRNGKADALLITKLDRLTRSVKDLGQLVDHYFREGSPWSLLSVGDSIDTRTASGRLVLNVLGSVSQWEREAIGERTREALGHIKEQGSTLGRPDYGWRWATEVPDEHGRATHQPEPIEQDNLRRMAELADQGLGAVEILAQLNAEGRRKRSGKPWDRSILYKLLKKLGKLPPRQRPYRSRRPAPPPADPIEVQSLARELRAQGLSLRAIAAELDRRGIHARKGRWHAATILKLVHRGEAS